jgi:hypothetical protein
VGTSRIGGVNGWERHDIGQKRRAIERARAGSFFPLHENRAPSVSVTRQEMFIPCNGLRAGAGFMSPGCDETQAATPLRFTQDHENTGNA